MQMSSFAMVSDDPEGSESVSAYAKMTKPKVAHSGKRFVPMAERTAASDLSVLMAEHLLDAQEFSQWRGVSMYKSCYDYALYPLLLQEMRPRTIIESGAHCGASAVWLDDLCRANLGENYCTIISNDLTLENIPEHLRHHPTIEFIEASNCNLVETIGAERLRKLPRPLLWIEDAHHEFPEILQQMHTVLLPGDYIVVEDTNAVVHKVWQNAAWLAKHDREEQMEENIMCQRKCETLREFCIKYEELYAVDSHYQDMFGYNVGKTMNSIVKRIA